VLVLDVDRPLTPIATPEPDLPAPRDFRRGRTRQDIRAIHEWLARP
jgi:hypothetical protein